MNVKSLQIASKVDNMAGLLKIGVKTKAIAHRIVHRDHQRLFATAKAAANIDAARKQYAADGYTIIRKAIDADLVRGTYQSLINYGIHLLMSGGFQCRTSTACRLAIKAVPRRAGGALASLDHAQRPLLGPCLF